jgi:hypothetical protein
VNAFLVVCCGYGANSLLCISSADLLDANFDVRLVILAIHFFYTIIYIEGFLEA